MWITEPDLKIVVPLLMQREIIAASHVYLTAHYKADKMLQRIRNSFYWLNMYTDIVKFVNQCVPCQVTGQRNDFYGGSHASTDTNILGVKCHADLKGPLPADAFNNKYILVMLEASTRFLIAQPIPNKEAQTVAQHILQRWVPLFGIPQIIRTDQGKEFNCTLFQILCDTLLIRHEFSPSDNHQGNLSERVLRELNVYLKVIGRENFKKWGVFIPIFNMAYNAHIHASLGMSPFQALTGRSMPLPIAIALPPPLTNTTPLSQIIDSIINEVFLKKNVLYN